MTSCAAAAASRSTASAARRPRRRAGGGARRRRRASTCRSGRRNTSAASPAPRGRHRRRVRQGRAARLRGPAHLLVRRAERGLARRSTTRSTTSSGRPSARRPTRTSRSTTQNIDYNDMLDKIRTAALGDAAPMVAKLPILWGVEFAAKGELAGADARGRRLPDRRVLAGRDEVGDLGRQALRRADQQRDDGASSGTPRSSPRPGSIPRTPPATWDDVVAYSKQIKEKTGKNGYGMVAKRQRRQHAVPLHAAALGLRRRRARRGRGRARPTRRSMINNDGRAWRRCRPSTTCTSATSRCRPRR